MIAQWTTEFDTANGVMTHTFDKGVKVVTNLKFKSMTTFRGDKKVDTTDFAESDTIEDYFEFLTLINEHVKEIQQ